MMSTQTLNEQLQTIAAQHPEARHYYTRWLADGCPGQHEAIRLLEAVSAVVPRDHRGRPDFAAAIAAIDQAIIANKEASVFWYELATSPELLVLYAASSIWTRLARGW